MKDVLAIIGAVLALAVLILIGPAFAVLVGWIAGFLVELFLGAKPTDWLNLTLGTERFVKGDLPKVTAILAMVAMFFGTAKARKKS